MKDKSNQFRHESLQDTNAVVKYLKALAEGIEKGTLQFRDEESEIGRRVRSDASGWYGALRAWLGGGAQDDAEPTAAPGPTTR